MRHFFTRAIAPLVAASVALLVGAAAHAQTVNGCQSKKKLCVAKKEAALLKCHSKAEKTGAAVDPACVQKAHDKFDDPAKGCFAKLEAKGGCLTTGDTVALEGKVDAFVTDAVIAVDPGYPAPVLNACSAGKKKCVGTKAKALLKCHSKAEKTGTLDPLCLQKAKDKFDGGANPSKGCFAKVEAKPPCLTSGDTAVMEAQVDAFVDDIVCNLDPSEGTCPTPTPIPTPTATATPACSNFITTWGRTGSGNGQFSAPTGLGYGNGHVYVADRDNARVQEFGSAGTFVGTWGTMGSGNGQFIGPIDVAVDSVGNIYVTDETGRIQKFDSTHTFLTTWGSLGNADGQFQGAAYIAIDASDNVYVADQQSTGPSVHDRIQKFTNSGTFITKWGSNGTADGQFQTVTGIGVDASGNIYVGDAGNDRVQKFTNSGTFLNKWGTSGTGDGQFSSPTGVTVDSAGHIYVADSGNSRVQEFDTGGTFLAKWGVSGSGLCEFQGSSLSDVITDSTGNIYTVEFTDRVQKFAAP